jgi:xanthine dehydrogenase large subunit
MSSRIWHQSGELHVTGKSKFVGEEVKPEGLLYAKFLFSPVARGRVINLDFKKALDLPGVFTVLTADDIPGINLVGRDTNDEPLLPKEMVDYLGQPVAMVLAVNPFVAQKGVELIKFEYKELPPMLSLKEADKAEKWYEPEKVIASGDVSSGLSKAEYVITGEVLSSNQEHFYFETQRCLAIPGEDKDIYLLASTQSTTEVQESVARVLKTNANNVIVDVKRLGGAFGGKESSATLWASLAALGAHISGKPVEVKLTRQEDFLYTGKRHPYLGKYQVGFNDDGEIVAYDVELIANGGAYIDLSLAILQRAMFHAENAYYIPNIRIRGRVCRTNLPPNTAFRGFGAPQSILVMESVIEKIACFLKKDPLEIRLKNLYQAGQLTPYKQRVTECNLNKLFQRLKELSQYDKLKKEVLDFNHTSNEVKQGLATVPVKFGISFTSPLLNQGSALIWVYLDGTLSVTTGGVEMGQEVSTKVAIVVSRTLGVKSSNIRIESSNTQRVGNASPTAASTGSDINGNAARNAVETIKSRLVTPAVELLIAEGAVGANPENIVFSEGYAFSSGQPAIKIKFSEIVAEAYQRRIALGAYGFYKTPGLEFDKEKMSGSPFYYYVFGCALVRVELNTITGDYSLRDVFIVHENGKSLSSEIDRGQIIGAFMQSYGWCTMEEMSHNDKGKYQANGPSTYKIPCIRDFPDNLMIEMIESESEFSSVMGSKAIGEPPYIYGEAAFFAIKNALKSINNGREVDLKFPATPEAVLLAIDKVLT